MEAHRKIPVILITGFLGAGKTTFINEVIRKHQHLKLVLIENEFGEKSIDQDLIVGMRSENIFDLSNGCICCSISNEFSLTLLDLADKAGRVDYLLIETTGIADLANVIKPFYSDESLKEKYELIGSICLIDAINHEIQFAATEQQMQMILSDLLLVNKSSKVKRDELSKIKTSLKAFNATAEISLCDHGKLKDFKLESFLAHVRGNLEKRLTVSPMFRLIESKKFSTFTHEFPGSIDLDRFKYWFNYFAAINQLKVYRVKGILFPRGQSNKTIVQSVGGSVDYSEGSFADPMEEKMNRLVFIGRELDFEQVSFELQEYLSADNIP